LVCWFAGLLVCWFAGLLVCWFAGLLVCCFRSLFELGGGSGEKSMVSCQNV
ncbi:hypothetical protein HGG82_15250, partial [Marinomonas sp. M1K-6]|nr:hypothetical protein [Marinomonas profundi]